MFLFILLLSMMMMMVINNTRLQFQELEQQISASSIAHVYGIDKELQTVEDIDNLEGQPDEVYMQV